MIVRPHLITYFPTSPVFLIVLCLFCFYLKYIFEYQPHRTRSTTAFYVCLRLVFGPLRRLLIRGYFFWIVRNKANGYRNLSTSKVFLNGG